MSPSCRSVQGYGVGRCRSAALAFSILLLAACGSQAPRPDSTVDVEEAPPIAEDIDMLALAEHTEMQARVGELTLAELSTCSQAPDSNLATLCLQQLWHLLAAESQTGRAQLSLDEDRHLAGWAQVFAIAGDNRGAVEIQARQLSDWLTRNQGHQARRILPNSILALLRQQPVPTQRIALVLPLSGPLSTAGQAVLDGYMSAQFELIESGFNGADISIYDSAAVPMALLAQELAGEAFDLVVGPLDLDNLATFLQNYPSERPVLGLNRLPSPSGSENALGFSLAIESEALQIAAAADSQEWLQALVLFQDSTWGDRAAASFVDRWTESGHDLIGLVRLINSTTLAETLSTTLHLDQSDARRQQLQTLLGKRLEHTPRRRQDIDMVFLASSPALARQVLPTLAFSFAQDVPVLAVSRVFSDSNPAVENRDLAPLRLPAPPWLVTGENSLAGAPSGRPLELRYLEAMGYDAFHLARRFDHLTQPGTYYLGRTGLLSRAEDGNLSRTMDWAGIDGNQLRERPW